MHPHPFPHPTAAMAASGSVGGVVARVHGDARRRVRNGSSGGAIGGWCSACSVIVPVGGCCWRRGERRADAGRLVMLEHTNVAGDNKFSYHTILFPVEVV